MSILVCWLIGPSGELALDVWSEVPAAVTNYMVFTQEVATVRDRVGSACKCLIVEDGVLNSPSPTSG